MHFTRELVESKTHTAIPDGFEFLHPEIDKRKVLLATVQCHQWIKSI
jgi:hypothetical protein